jgi:hypothetical protein
MINKSKRRFIMKKIFLIIPLLAFVSCVSSGIFKQELSGMNSVVIPSEGLTYINVCRSIDLDPDNLVGTALPGEIVKVLSRNGSAALVKIKNGETGWMDVKFLKCYQ